MMDVERHKSNTHQAEVLRFGVEDLHLSQHLDRSRGDVVELQARCNELWHHPEPYSTRVIEDTSLKTWSRCKWKKVCLDLLPQVFGGLGIDDTTVTERVEPSSFVAAGDRLPVHLNSSYSLLPM